MTARPRRQHERKPGPATLPGRSSEMRRGNLAYVKVGRRRLITRWHLNQFPGIAS